MKIVFLISACISIAIAEPAKAWWGKYGSATEAWAACREWKKQGDDYIIHFGSNHPINIGMRYCKKDEKTKQFLGIKRIILPESTRLENWEPGPIIKRFRY